MMILRSIRGFALAPSRARALSTLEAPRTYVEMERRDGEHARAGPSS